MVATNPEEQSPAGIPISAPMMGRLAFIHLRPEAEEVLRLPLDDRRTRATGASDFDKAAPPRGDGLRRDRERDARPAPDRHPDGGRRRQRPVGRASRLGARAPHARACSARRHHRREDRSAARPPAAVGNSLAGAYAAILDSRNVLPSVQDILTDPKPALPSPATARRRSRTRSAPPRSSRRSPRRTPGPPGSTRARLADGDQNGGRPDPPEEEATCRRRRSSRRTAPPATPRASTILRNIGK
jgi:hypothetical protein